MIEYVKLTPEQIARRNASMALWVETLKAQARDDSDPETQANARAILAVPDAGGDPFEWPTLLDAIEADRKIATTKEA